jgi:hypothetical protein
VSTPESATALGHHPESRQDTSATAKPHPEYTRREGRMLAAALAYGAVGLAVFPLHDALDGVCSCRDREACEKPGKHPRTRHGFHDATCDEAQIRAWWGRWPHANIGIPTGERSGVVAVDIDPRHGGDSLYAEWQSEDGAYTETLTVRTPTGGRHYLYRWRPDLGINSRAGKDPLRDLGIDRKTDGGYIVVAPSLHACGDRYRFLNSIEPQEMPEALVARLRPPAKPERAAPPSASGNGYQMSSAFVQAEQRRHALAILDDLREEVATAPKGARNDTANEKAWKAGGLVKAGYLEAGPTFEVLKAAAMTAGLSASEAADVVGRAMDRAEAWLLPAPEPITPPVGDLPRIEARSDREYERKLAELLKTDVPTRLRLGAALGGYRDGNRAYGLTCPKCREPGAWFWIEPSVMVGARCSGCGWRGWLDHLAAGAKEAA